MAARKNALEDVSAASSALHAQNCASGTGKKVRHCARYVNIKVLSEQNFSAHEQNPRTYTGKCVSEKTRIFTYFTQCDVFTY